MDAMRERLDGLDRKGDDREVEGRCCDMRSSTGGKKEVAMI